jgi:hypothetical protein
MGINYPMVP